MEYQGCYWMDTAINFGNNFVSDCCKRASIGSGMPILIKDYHGEPIDWEKLFEIKHARIRQQKLKTIPECEGCDIFSNYEFKMEKNYRIFNLHQAIYVIQNAYIVVPKVAMKKDTMYIR